MSYKEVMSSTPELQLEREKVDKEINTISK
jgi:hypothetical protein